MRRHASPAHLSDHEYAHTVVQLTLTGELQGAVASLSGVAAIVGPFAMTQSLALFTRRERQCIFPARLSYLLRY